MNAPRPMPGSDSSIADRLSWGIEHSTEHLRPIWAAVRDCGVELLVVPQTAARFAATPGRASIVLMGATFKKPRDQVLSIADRFAGTPGTCRTGVIAASCATRELYLAAARTVVSKDHGGSASVQRLD